MSPLNEQLPLAVQLRDDATFDNYYVADNALLVNQLKQQLKEGERYLYVYGKAGSGRSHLLQAACHQAQQMGKSAMFLPLEELKSYPADSLFEAIEGQGLICLDDLDKVLGGHVLGGEVWELALFNLFNRLKDSNTALLVSAEVAVRELPVQLADLQSRLSWGSVYQLNSLNDEQRQQALQFRASKRGMELTNEVAQFIYHRCQRDTSALFVVLDDLDQASLKQQRKLTIPFVKSVLNW